MPRPRGDHRTHEEDRDDHRAEDPPRRALRDDANSEDIAEFMEVNTDRAR
jgi:hypothetical protein